jgi:ABC-type multidrug transport system ATPase subunit
VDRRDRRRPAIAALRAAWKKAVALIEARELTKHYGDKLAVDHLSFVVEACQVTGFLGPNGSEKSTTIRLILGLDRPNFASR